MFETKKTVVRLDNLPEMIDRKEVMRLLRVSSTRTLRVMCAMGLFPKPIEFNQRLHRWSRAVVVEWFEKHRAASVAGLEQPAAG